jgi:ABC-type nickel/cobalt efflux system permease component RcnA
MKLPRYFSIALLLVLLSSLAVTPVQAHPADIYAHTINVTITQTGLEIHWVIKPGPLLTNFLWYEMDVDEDGILSQTEVETWSSARAALMTATLDDKPLPLLMDSLQLPTSLRAFQAGEEFITFELSGTWEQTSVNAQRLVLENGLEPPKSINWFYLTAEDGTAFLFPDQKSHLIAIDMIRNRSLLADQNPLLTAWDSGTPTLPLGQQKDVVTETAEQVVPELAEQSPQEILLELVRSKEFSFSFYFFALLIALALGALHALTPGHGKTVVAAYLVGSRGTSLHAIALGTVVTLTHTGSVFLLGIITLAASQYILPTTIIPFLEILSGVLIVGLGLYLLWQRFLFWQKSRTPEPEQKRKVSLSPMASKKPLGTVKVQNLPANMHHHGDGKVHSHEVPETITWRSLIALGISGGLVPCPDAIAILLVAIAINRIMLGLALILSFSLGLAVVLIVIGLLMVNSRRLFDRFGFLDRLAPFMPVVSAVIVLLLGFALTWGAVVRARETVSFAAPVQRSVSEARVLYLVEWEDRVKSLFITEYETDTSRVITPAAQSVAEFEVAPNQKSVAYVVQTEERENELWLMDLANMEAKKISSCVDAICSGIVWSPDGTRLIYEHLSLLGNSSGLPTLWWINVVTGEEQPVFQESQLPGGNPRWSPNGEWLSYATPEGIRLYNLENGETRVIENILGAAALWSPNSKSILLRDVVIRHDQFITQLFLYDLETEQIVNLNPNDSMENILAAWSPDGGSIAVVRRDLSVPRGDQIWLLRADGSDARMLTNDADVLHSSLNWSPDGKYLLYDVYFLDAYPFETALRVIELESGEVRDLEIKGFNPKWVW